MSPNVDFDQAHGARVPPGLSSPMATSLNAADRLLMDRYFDCVLLRYSEGVYDLDTARAELAEAFLQMTREESDFRTHMQAVVDARDDA